LMPAKCTFYDCVYEEELLEAPGFLSAAPIPSFQRHDRLIPSMRVNALSLS